MSDAPEIAVILNSHENSPVFRDTLESVRHHWTDRVMVVADAKNWSQFRDADLPAMMLEGFYHGKASAPYRNVCLGLMKAWETWGSDVGWYCYMEYDCLVGSSDTRLHLRDADLQGIWLLGNDHRVDPRRMPFLERFERKRLDLHYLLGCCLFFNGRFMSELANRDFFERFLSFTNFHTDSPRLLDGNREEEAYDVSEFLYPTLAASYGGRVAEIACWEGSHWRGDGARYPMRFRPDLTESLYTDACVMHPLKSYDGFARAAHRVKRGLTRPPSADIMPVHAGLRVRG